uniref:Uncharacterized protein n=1 Tax=Anopheles minimus TaxID=112268 RepID=A0A182WNK5_9DIPT
MAGSRNEQPGTAIRNWRYKKRCCKSKGNRLP